MALLWAALATSAIGDQIFLVALSWVAVASLGTQAGYLTALQPATILMVALFVGRAADRIEPRGMMVAADLLRAAVLAALVAAWIWRGQPPAWALVAAVLALAAGHALFRPALQAAIPPLVGHPSLLPATNALLDSTERIARLLGPGLVGLLGAALPAVHFVTFDIATFVLSAAAVSVIRLRRKLARPALSGAPPSLRDSLLQGLRAVRGQPILMFALLCNSAPVAGIWWAAMFLAVPLVLGTTPRGLASFGLVISAYGSTNLLATLLFGGLALPRRPGWLLFGADVVLGGGIVAMGLAARLLPDAWLVPGLCAGAAFGAVGGPMADIPTAVLRQTRLALADQAAAMRAWLVATNLGTLVCLALAPLVFASFGVPAAMVAGGLIMTGCGVAGLLRHHATQA